MCSDLWNCVFSFFLALISFYSGDFIDYYFVESKISFIYVAVDSLSVVLLTNM